MKRDDERAFRDYVAVRLEQLRRTAYLYCRDWHLADDLVGVTVGKLYVHWRRAQAADNVDAYVHGILIHAWLDERRRPWRREQPSADVPDSPIPSADRDRGDVLKALADLPQGRRACVVLRYYCDLSVEQTAAILGISTGTVKSQTARALESLRTLAAHLNEED